MKIETKNVTINLLTTNSYSKHEEKKKGFSASLSLKGVSLSYGKDKLESKTDSVEKSSLVSGNNMNIKSKNGSINISGTDIKVGNDLDLNAKKDIVIKASEENNSSSNNQQNVPVSKTSVINEIKAKGWTASFEKKAI